MLKKYKALKDKNITSAHSKKLKLEDYDTNYNPFDEMDKESIVDALEQNAKEIEQWQDKLYAQNKYSLLIVLQAMDAAGKDSCIRHVMKGVNPQGCTVNSFKKPSEKELNHDYLWRTTLALPGRGMIGIFNRSHYEEVLVTRVHPEYILYQNIPSISSIKDIDNTFWQKRYESIRNYEKHLAENGTVIIKIFLNLSKKEQKKRFLERMNEPEKNWKFNAGDLKERALWKEYRAAYQEAIANTTTEYAPWYVVPADNQWVSRLIVGDIINETLKKLGLTYPEVSDNEKLAYETYKNELQNEKQKNKPTT